MNVLIACEESQTSCKAFRGMGHNAFSCDVQKCSGGHPEWHILGDCIKVINGNCAFKCESGDVYKIKGEWDLIIGHPPCTYLSGLNGQYTNTDSKKYPKHKILKRILNQIDASIFFMKLYNAKCKRVCIENPTGYMNSHFRKPDMIVHPYYFGDGEYKRTCLWCRGLPNLDYKIPDKKPDSYGFYISKGKKKEKHFFESVLNLPPQERTKIRSKTFPGIARAFSQQWGIFEKKSKITKLEGV